MPHWKRIARGVVADSDVIDVQVAFRHGGIEALIDSIPNTTLARLNPQAVYRDLCSMSHLAIGRLLCIASNEEEHLAYQIH